MQKVIVVDDDQDILDLVSFNLSRAGFECVTMLEGSNLPGLVQKQPPDLLILDIMLPGTNGLELLKQLNFDERLRNVPVILLTARDEEVDRVLGLELGADDYVTKPFSVRELILRVKRTLDRANPAEEPRLLRCNGITLDSDRYDVQVQGRSVRLTTTEFNLLAHLLRNRGRVMTRDQLLEEVWGFHYDGTARTVDTHIQRLREKLGQLAGCIETIRGVGYKVDVHSCPG